MFEEKLKLFSIKDGRTALRAFSDTCWMTKENNLAAVINTLPALISTLKELQSSDATCEGLLVRIGSFEFLLQLLILKECFELSRYSSEYLQREEMDLVTAVDAVATLKNKFSSFCNDEKFAKFVHAAKVKAAEFGIEDSLEIRPTNVAKLALLDTSFSHEENKDGRLPTCHYY